jgi:GTP-binding protein
VFVDVARIRVIGGPGGAGAVAFRRERGVPRGGPSGGRGGDGGHVILRANSSLDTLLDYSYRQQYKAGRAGHGEGGNRAGVSGAHLTLPVPLGTLVRDAETGERLGELLEEGEELVVAHGGRGGRGNASYTSATHQAPREWGKGKWGDERTIELELKLIADVGLVGQPNAGKSTFLSRVTSADPKIADYPFSTLSPNLGVVGLSDGRSFVIADIPGIIEGANEGKGLGTQFLRHIERTRTLALLVPLEEENPQAAYNLLRKELRGHDPALAEITHCVLLTKSDLVSADSKITIEAPKAWGVFQISAVTGSGLKGVLDSLWTQVRTEKNRQLGDAGQDPFDEVETWRP